VVVSSWRNEEEAADSRGEGVGTSRSRMLSAERDQRDWGCDDGGGVG
jgi:hypothetical protein